MKIYCEESGDLSPEKEKFKNSSPESSEFVKQIYRQDKPKTVDPTPEEREALPLGPDMRYEFARRIPLERQGELQSEARNYISQYNQDGSISFTDFGAILSSINTRADFTDFEKVYTWSFIEEAKGQFVHGVRAHYINNEYNISNDGVNPAVIDSLPFGAIGTAVHCAVEFTDAVHGVWGGRSGDHGVAEKEILDHEALTSAVTISISYPVFENFSFKGMESTEYTLIDPIISNIGDYNASLATVGAFRAYRSGGFDAYTQAWLSSFLAEPPAK